MKDLHEITMNKLQRMLRKGEEDAQNGIGTLLREADMRVDFLANLGERMTSEFTANGKVYFNTPQGEFRLHDNAITQLAAKYDIGARFTKTLMKSNEDWKRALIAYNLNQFSHNAGKRRFLMRAIDDEIRGVLSDRYKILDSAELATTFLNGALAKGAKFAGGHYSGLNLYLEVVHPELVQVDTANNGVQELIFGGRLKTSDFGCGALQMSIFYLKVICSNGMIGTSTLNERHVGGELPEGFNFQTDTYDTYTKAMSLKMRDMVAQVFSEEAIANEIIKVQKASQVEIDTKTYLARLQKDNKILKSEIPEIETVLMNNRVTDGVEGENTLWRLTQAISAVGREKEPVRQRELFELSGAMVQS